ncbi:hypothetical protein [Thiothrix unzii]|uniref:Uncharacterized protein n=1 Tax=Thiothrix unzii TaxID=111769 RepID=A0A975FCE1_9GAMM|nr:hypothetical protein [Thiothrix unzii]QTR55436.1 hypothetical protein J9260_18115 [Thiothrix unzii]
MKQPIITLAVVGIAAVSLMGCQLKEDSMDYFQNESEVMIIKGENHDLNIENRLDRVSLYGSVDITHDQAGLAQALRLKGVVDGMVSTLAKEQTKGVLPAKIVPILYYSIPVLPTPPATDNVPLSGFGIQQAVPTRYG